MGTQLNEFNQEQLGTKWVRMPIHCRIDCYQAGLTDCNAALFDEDSGKCQMYNLNGYHNKIMRLGNSTNQLPSTSKWIFTYADQQTGWVLVLKRVFGDINFSNASWIDMTNEMTGYNDYWAGLSQLRTMTYNGKDTLRLKFSKDNVKYEIVYDNFVLDTEENSFEFTVGAYSGNYHDCLSGQSALTFVTNDDNSTVTTCKE